MARLFNARGILDGHRYSEIPFSVDAGSGKEKMNSFVLKLNDCATTTLAQTNSVPGQ